MTYKLLQSNIDGKYLIVKYITTTHIRVIKQTMSSSIMNTVLEFYHLHMSPLTPPRYSDLKNVACIDLIQDYTSLCEFNTKQELYRLYPECFL